MWPCCSHRRAPELLAPSCRARRSALAALLRSTPRWRTTAENGAWDLFVVLTDEEGDETPPNCRRVLRECHAYLSPNFNNEFEQTMSIRVSTQGVRERESSRSCSNRRSSPNRRRALDLLKSATGMHTNGRRNVPDCRRQGDQKSHGSCWRARLESAQSDRPHRTEIRKRVKQKALTQLKSAACRTAGTRDFRSARRTLPVYSQYEPNPVVLCRVRVEESQRLGSKCQPTRHNPVVGINQLLSRGPLSFGTR